MPRDPRATCGMFGCKPASGCLNNNGGRQVQNARQRSTGCHGNDASKLKPSPDDSAVLVCPPCHSAHARRHERLKAAALSVLKAAALSVLPPLLPLSPPSLSPCSLAPPSPLVIQQLASPCVVELASPRVIQLALPSQRLSVDVPTTGDVWDALASGRPLYAKLLLVRRHAANQRVLRVKRARAARPACLCGRASQLLCAPSHPRTRAPAHSPIRAPPTSAPALVRSSSACLSAQAFARRAV